MKHTEVKFEDVKVGDTLYIESKHPTYTQCNGRTCVVKGIWFNAPERAICVDFGKGFVGHNACGYVDECTGYNLWNYENTCMTLFKVEEEKEEVPETKYTYSGKVLKHLKVGDVFFLDKFPANPSLEGKFYEVVLDTGNYYGFDFKRVCDRSVPIYTAFNSMDIVSEDMVITLTRTLGKTKQDKIAKLEAKLERITNKLKALKESGE